MSTTLWVCAGASSPARIDGYPVFLPFSKRNFGIQTAINAIWSNATHHRRPPTPRAVNHIIRIHNNMKISIPILAATLALGGCASVLNDVTHPIKVETLTQAGETVSGADCKLTNDYGVFKQKSGETGQIRRSSKDLDIVCTDQKNPDAVARATSRANGGMFGNIILGGGIGAIIDHNKGTAYTYPTWVQLVFGKTLAFDRSMEKEGQPVPPSIPEAKEAKN